MLTPETFGRLAAKVWPADEAQHDDAKRLLGRLDKVCTRKDHPPKAGKA